MPEPREHKRIVVAITGASGAAYGVRLLQLLQQLPHVQTHLVVSNAAWRTLQHEMDLQPAYVHSLADVVHDNEDVGASIASGSFRAHGMVIAPCSMRTLAAIANGLADSLLTRAADVMLKERRRLVLLTRESPLHLVHLRNMTTVTEMGGIICPPMPAFYQLPQTLDDIVQHSAARVLDLLDIEHELSPRWQGLRVVSN
ncbi:UbiX family flavin prenyltransferase [Diaphorobacter sp. HDW4B]|uniref:UbiX family flavin prenyltransferase n=1 Tax=Diaphorobacter sp. HDW4B TaxID=2714925 RepID=UPI00140A9E0D|nr:UbiX family flavin prenyltransferase [Diaphorobacter sp. HDW4B]QIL72002.1 UbiX family flavin prenyltransferase [Diaphorobacter sp. HDW4B]